MTKETTDKTQEMRINCNIGSCLVCLGKVEEAIPALENSLAIARQLASVEGQTPALVQLAEASLIKEDEERARQLCNQGGSSVTGE